MSLLVVSVKADQLEDALEHVDPEAVAEGVVLPVMNGLEHMDAIRERFPGRVAAGALSYFDAYRVGRTQIVQTTPTALVTMASEELPPEDLERAREILEQAGIDVELDDDERRVLWRKAVRLAVLAPATVLTGRTVGELRNDHEWRPLIEEGSRGGVRDRGRGWRPSHALRSVDADHGDGCQRDDLGGSKRAEQPRERDQRGHRRRRARGRAARRALSGAFRPGLRRTPSL